jgi:hypothetical protein
MHLVFLQAFSGINTNRETSSRFPRLVESTMIHLQTQSAKDPVPADLHLPIMPPNDLQQMQVQPPGTKFPNPSMPICAFEICTSALGLGSNVPATASLVCYQGSVVDVRDSLRKRGIVFNGL